MERNYHFLPSFLSSTLLLSLSSSTPLAHSLFSRVRAAPLFPGTNTDLLLLRACAQSPQLLSLSHNCQFVRLPP